MLSAAVAYAIPPREFAELPPLTLSEKSTSGEDARKIENQIVIDWLERDHVNVSVAASRAGPWLGVDSAEASAALDAQLGLHHGEGLVVVDVVTNSPAAKAGLQKNDVLIEFEGQRLVHPVQFRKLLHMKTEGEKVAITFYRAGKKQVITAKLEMPPVDHEVRRETTDGRKFELQSHPESEKAANDQAKIGAPLKNAPSPNPAVQVSKAPASAKPKSSRMTYMQRQGWKADLRTVLAMAKWLIAPEPPATPGHPLPEPITTSITEVVHGRNLGNI
jgi:hypothetical protein